MKKLVVALLLFPMATYAFQKKSQFKREDFRFEEALEEFPTLNEAQKRRLNDSEFLKLILGKHVDRHLCGVLTPGRAQVVAYKIHENLEVQLRTKKRNYFEAGKALTQEPDAAIVGTCAMIKQNMRKHGKAGMISGHSGFLGPNRFALWLTSCTFEGERFFDHACPCDFYDKLTDEQLEQLKKGTQEAGK